MNSSKMHKTISLMKDIETISGGNIKKIKRRGKNKLKYKLLNKFLGKIGFRNW